MASPFLPSPQRFCAAFSFPSHYSQTATADLFLFQFPEALTLLFQGTRKVGFPASLVVIWEEQSTSTQPRCPPSSCPLSLTLSVSSSRCSTDLGTDGRAGVFCSGIVSCCILLSGPPDGHYHCHSHGNDASPQGPPHGRARPHLRSRRPPSCQPGRERCFHCSNAGEQPSCWRKGNVSFV